MTNKWKGGLPPVGEACEVFNRALNNADWEKCEVRSIGKHRVLYDSESCEERVAHISEVEFRPLKKKTR